MLLSRMEKEDFAAAATDVGNKLWGGEFSRDRTASLSARASAILNRNSKMLKRLGHYFGGSFYFEGECIGDWTGFICLKNVFRKRDLVPVRWYVPDRRYQIFACQASSDLTLEYFPSLRSPYTAIGHKRVLEMVRTPASSLS